MSARPPSAKQQSGSAPPDSRDSPRRCISPYARSPRPAEPPYRPFRDPASAPAALAALLAGRWDRAAALAQEADSLGWSGGTNARSVVFVYALVALSSADGAEPGPVTTELWSATVAAGAALRAGMTTTHELPNGEQVPQRHRPSPEALNQGYRTALTQALAHRPLSAEEAEAWLTWCMETAAARCEGIVGRQHRGAYPRAASAVAACHETACARGQPRVGEQLVERMRSQYPRHSAFQRALREALGGVA
ncbi:MAG: hypothetical protein ACLFMS_08930 [Halorhodospira sp.]